MSQRLKGVVHYDGTGYRGWQRQADAITVQGASETSLAEVLGTRTSIVAAGRTDTGVHARGQVIHLEHDTSIDVDDLRRAWNAKLPHDIWIQSLAPVDARFHARHDAVSRTYRYFIADRADARSPFIRRYHWALDRAPAWNRIRDATEAILGRHDFRRFAKGTAPASSDSRVSPGECIIETAEWHPTPEGQRFEITANRFLRHMVRSLVGALVAVGQSRLARDEIRAALDPAGERPSAGYAPPEGLFLWSVAYRGGDR